jgi:hypothetical protein
MYTDFNQFLKMENLVVIRSPENGSMNRYNGDNTVLCEATGVCELFDVFDILWIIRVLWICRFDIKEDRNGNHPA